MNNLEIYNKVFIDTFEVNENDLVGLHLKESNSWDSVGHMMLIAALEDAFNISLEPEDLMSIDSYSKGIEVITKYGVEI